jgi:octaprenyl-diphosphate synthase
MEQYQARLQAELNQLDQVIRQDLQSEVALINTVSDYIIQGGGKRIRPLLVILCSKLLGNQQELIYKMAAMIEYIHTATLLHDDVVDESGLRRGRATANAIFGNAATVLVGDFIYTRAFQLMVRSNLPRVLQIMADSTNIISEGEVLQLLNIGRSDLNEAEYLQVIKLKTAKLFEAAARVAAVISNASAKEEEHLAKYAIYLGTAFQIVDDILDYAGTPEIMGKNVGDDLLEGKVTLPLIYLLNNAPVHLRQLIVTAINEPQTAAVAPIITLIKESAALDYCKTMAKNYADKAQQELATFTAGTFKDCLTTLARMSVQRIA